MSRLFHRVAFIAFALLATVGGNAWADRHGDPRNEGRSYQAVRYQDPPYAGYEADPRDNGSLPASVHRIQRETGGQVLRAQPYERDGRRIYRVKVLTPQGRIRVYEDDPGSSRGLRANPPMSVYQREPLPQSPPPSSNPRDGRQPYPRQDQEPYQQRFPQQQSPRGHRRSG